MSFAGMRVLALESRRSSEIAELIRKQGGDPLVAPAMREVPVSENAEVFQFADRLFAGEFDLMVLLTGVGTRQLSRLLASRYGEDAFSQALRKITLVARGPKSVAALREMGLTPTAVAPEPNTWRELMDVLRGRPERRIAIQEYGRSNPELLDALRDSGAGVMTVRVYQYGLPEDAEPLRQAAEELAAGRIQAVLFTSAVQIEHLALVARQQGLESAMLASLQRCFVASIGPTTTEALEQFDVHPAMEPSHPKMGFLVKEAAERAHG